MLAMVYCCDGCRIVDAETSAPAPCLLVMHNGEPPKRCVCGRGAETDWRLLTKVGSDSEGGCRYGDGE